MKDFFSVIPALPGIVLTMICWGAYGPVLHKGQSLMGGDRWKPLICVGLAYFIVAIVVPVLYLGASGQLSGGWKVGGISWSLASGTAGAVGALGIILAMSAGGKPHLVMPLVFGGAPIINVLVSNFMSGVRFRDLSPLYLAGVIIVAVGAAIVMAAPKPKGSHGAPSPATTSTAAATVTSSPSALK